MSRSPQPSAGSALPIKKSVSLAWGSLRLDFDVAQALFSSHQVDRGSRLLLESLDPETFPEVGKAVDFGCGYGVLGIAWQAARPGWAMDYVDRDALAVAFARHNATRMLAGGSAQAQFQCDITVTAPEDGYDLALWNVPGKAGRTVISELLDVALDALAQGGILAVVVVHPLADLFAESIDRDDVDTVHVQRGKEHTVVHLRRASGDVIRRDPFLEGAFDRATEVFEASGLEWMLTPVTGLPEYDSLNHATELAIRAMAEAEREVARWLILEPGVGHLAAAAFQRWPSARGVLAGRDSLALRASHRAVGGVLSIVEQPLWGLADLALEEPVDLAVVALPEQAKAEELGALLTDLDRLVQPGGSVILHGRSTEISRIGAAARKRRGWRLGAVAKLRGSAAVVVRSD